MGIITGTPASSTTLTRSAAATKLTDTGTSKADFIAGVEDILDTLLVSSSSFLYSNIGAVTNASVTVPEGITKLIVTGSGAGGGGGASGSNEQSGESGGAGGSCIERLITVVGGETLTINIGSGGSCPGSWCTSGTSGGATTISGSSSGTVLTLGGGGGGSSSPPGGSGSTGSVSGGSVGRTSGSFGSVYNDSVGTGGSAGSYYNAGAGAAGMLFISI